MTAIFRDTYRVSERVLLVRGDVFRARGGPVYVLGSGERIPLGTHGLYEFVEACIQGRSAWLLAKKLQGGSIEWIYVGPKRRKPDADNFLAIPHKIVKRREQ